MKGSSAAVGEIDSDRKEVKMKRINNFSFFHNFAYEKDIVFVSQKPMGSARAN